MQYVTEAEYIISREYTDSAGGVGASFSYDQSQELLTCPSNTATGETEGGRLNHSCANNRYKLVHETFKLLLVLCISEKTNLCQMVNKKKIDSE